MENLTTLIEETCRRFSDRTFIIHEKARMTYGEFQQAVNAFAAALEGMGIGKSDKVAVMLPNCPEFVIAYFAALRLGAVAVTVNVLSTAHELKHLLADSDARVLIAPETATKRYEEIKGDLPLCRHFIPTRGMTEPSPFTDMLKGPASIGSSRGIGPDDPAVMIYTAGLTGKPLGAVLTHGNLLSQAPLLKDYFQGNEDDRSLAVIPFFHAFGAAANMIATVAVGGGIVLMERFTLESIFTAIRNERVTYICAVPRLFLGMILHQGAGVQDLSSVRFCVTGGAAMPPEYITAFADKFAVPIVEGYGLTEAAPICSVNRLAGPNKPGSIGIPIGDVEVKTVDDRGEEVPRNVVGELVIRGRNVMKGYYKNETATEQVIRNGWLHTGDLARIDEEGCIFLTGRKKRMIITSGFNVYPREVEMVLEMHPAVAAARVEGKEDLLRGEIVKALIVRKTGAETDEKEILRHCRGYLSSYKIPRELEFVANL